MSAALTPLIAALDIAAAPIHFFLRDDDAGWHDERQLALLDCTLQLGVPLDLAVIPMATTKALEDNLRQRKSAAPHLIGLHQHGFAHLNHETEGRKCEFGQSRSDDQQRDDIRAGRERLYRAFGDQLDTFFTPPWNRCNASTPLILAELGFSGLSRSRGASPPSVLPEVSVDVDWSKQHRQSLEADQPNALALVAMELASRVKAGGLVGLMLHHADMGSTELAQLSLLLSATAQHPKVHWSPMRELFRSIHPS